MYLLGPKSHVEYNATHSNRHIPLAICTGHQNQFLRLSFLPATHLQVYLHKHSCKNYLILQMTQVRAETSMLRHVISEKD